MAKIADIASNIWLLELEEPTDVSIAAITQKLRASIGKLNNLLHTNFYINESSLEIIDSDNGREIAEDQAAIYTNIYLDYYYGKQAKAFLGANGVDSVQSVDQDGIKVTMVQKNQTAKNYLDLKKQNREELKQLVNSYKQNRATPRHVESDDKLSKQPPLIIDPSNNASYYENYGNNRKY